MIQNKKDLQFYLLEDARRAGITNKLIYWAKLLYGNEQAHSLKYLKILRLYEYYNNDNNFLKYWYRFRHSKLGLKYGIHIGINMIGYGFWMPHITGWIIINCKSMGNYCSANGGVVVGNKENQENRATIGDYVKLSIGVKVYGKITIGNHVIITPNSVIYKDIHTGAVVSSIPSVIVIKNDNLNDNIYYYENNISKK